MSDTETTTEPTGQNADDLSSEHVQTLVKATARAEFEDSMRAPKGSAKDTDIAASENVDQTDTSDDENANHEAAKWRIKLRDAESQNTALATRLEAMQRAAIDGQVAALGMKPAALWASGAQLEDLLDEDGVPDTAKVQQAAARAKDTLGIVAVKPAKPIGSLRSGAAAPQPPRGGFADAFRPRSHE